MEIKEKVVRVRPDDFSIISERLIKRLGLSKGEKCNTIAYTPVTHCPMSYSIAVNIDTGEVVSIVNSGQTKIKRLIAFRDSAPSGGGSGMPCGACREFLYQLNEENEDMETMLDYEKRETVTLKELIPNWWGTNASLKQREDK